MKGIITAVAALLSFNTWACPDLSGSYLDSNKESIVLTQRGCEELTVTSRPLSHTLLLNNEYVLVQEDVDVRAFGKGEFQQSVLVLEVKVEYKRNPGIPRMILPVRALNKYTQNTDGSLLESSTIFNDANTVLTSTKTLYRKQ